MKKKIDAKNLVKDIADLARERIAAGPVVSLQNMKNAFRKKAVPTILIIEDDDIMRRSLRRIFESMNYQVIAAQDAVELSTMLDQAVIDLIVLDVGLPWINGFELATMMKSHAQLQNVPIVFLSGHSEKAMVQKGFSVGANDYITKPFEVEKVQKTVRTLLELDQEL